MKNYIKLPSRHQQGVTLIELLLYVSLSAIILMVSSVFLSLLISSRIKNQTIAEIGQQGTQIIQEVTRAIRNADGINQPTAGNSGTTLSLSMSDSSANPTIFEIVNNRLQMREGSGSANILSSSRVVISGVEFKNLSRAGTPGNINFVFTLTHRNPEGINEYTSSQMFTGTASLRHP